MTIVPSRFLLGTILLLLLQSCAEVPPPRSLNDQPLQLITTMASAGNFAATPDRELIAFGSGGLQLLQVATGLQRQIDSREPLLLGWRRDGLQLAVASAVDGEQGQLALYDRDGRLVEQTALPGVPVALAWSRQDDLLIAGYRLREFSFGGNLSQWLLRVNGAEREVIELGDTTLKPATARNIKARLVELLKVSFSPAGDELILLQLHDPPAFPAYLQLVYRNWQAPNERKLLQLPLQSAEIAWGEVADTVAYRAVAGTWQRLPLWPADGEPSRHAVEITDPAEQPAVDTQMQRFADGTYLLAANGRLYRGSGLAPLPAAEDDKAWNLRKWRFAGLISPEEYLEVRP